jgi:hypothetical protein
VTTLPLLEVNTRHSRYVIDQNAGTLTRTVVADDGARLDHKMRGLDSGDVMAYTDLLVEPRLGGVIAAQLANGGWLRSTEIMSIEELDPEPTK